MRTTTVRSMERWSGASAADEADHRIKMFKELSRLAPLQAPDEPEEYRLRALPRGPRLVVPGRDKIARS